MVTAPLQGRHPRPCPLLGTPSLEGGEHVRLGDPLCAQRTLQVLARIVDQFVDVVFVRTQFVGQDDKRLLVDDTVTIALQVNGKLRGTIQMPKDSSKEANTAAALANTDVQKAMAGKPQKRVIVVPNRIVNVVV